MLEKHWRSQDDTAAADEEERSPQQDAVARSSYRAGIRLSGNGALVVVKGRGQEQHHMYVVKYSASHPEQTRMSQVLHLIRLRHAKYSDVALQHVWDVLQWGNDGSEWLVSSRKLMALALGEGNPTDESDEMLEYLLSCGDEESCMELIGDGRKMNGRCPMEVFEPFWDELDAYIREVADAADDRRRGGAEQQYFSSFVSVRQMRETIIARLKEKMGDAYADDYVPSESWVSWQFMPSSNCKLTSDKFKKRYNVRLQVQKRTLSISHPHKHYANAQLKLVRSWAVKHRPHCTFLSVDDKAKVTVGPPGHNQPAVLRPNNPTLGIVGHEPVALDHDFAQTSLVPSVILDTEIPDTVAKSPCNVVSVCARRQCDRHLDGHLNLAHLDIVLDLGTAIICTEGTQPTVQPGPWQWCHLSHNQTGPTCTSELYILPR